MQVRVSGAGGHHQQKGALAGLDAFEYGADGTYLIVATGDGRVDELVGQRLAVAADIGEALQVVACGITHDLARRRVAEIPEPELATIGVEAEWQLAATLPLDVVAILLGLLAAQCSVTAGFLGFDDGQRLAILAQQHVVAELVTFVAGAWLGHAFGQVHLNIEFFGNLRGVIDIPA